MDDLAKVRAELLRVHDDLIRWLPGQGAALERVGGRRFLQAQLCVSTALSGFDFDYFNERLLLGEDLLRGWVRLRALLGPARFAECARLFLLHEGRHIHHGMAYSNREISRAPQALAAADHDADVVSIELCLAWREARQAQRVARLGPMGCVVDVLDSALYGLRVFDDLDPAAPLCALKERRLRRYLYWHFQRARARAAPRQLPVERLGLTEPVVLELVGLPTQPAPAMAAHPGAHAAALLRLQDLPASHPLELVLYAGGRVYRRDGVFCHDLLAALRAGPRADPVSRVFNRLFEEHPVLVPA